MGVVRKHTTEIDGITYETTTLPATVGLSVFPRLVALLGDKILPLVFEVGGEGLEALFKDSKVIGVLISNIAERATSKMAEGEDPMSVLRDVLVKTTADKVRIGSTEVQGSVHKSFDSHFAGDYRHLIAVVGWVGGVNFMPASTEES